ncbi:MAG TPA: 30S ribosomal protein S8 [Candidatus Coprenecus stercoripullorum]|nr:30S ribosomal protein S8 [Candidatus Coprenecus stercoripullorum]
MTDPIADFLTRVRNAYLAKHRVVEIPSSKMKLELTRILFDKGYILSYKVVEGTPYNTIKIALKYHPQTRQAAVKKMIRISKPGLRKYVGVDDLPRVLNGLGVAILSTSRGVMTDKEAREQNVGGEVLCYVY